MRVPIIVGQVVYHAICHCLRALFKTVGKAHRLALAWVLICGFLGCLGLISQSHDRHPSLRSPQAAVQYFISAIDRRDERSTWEALVPELKEDTDPDTWDRMFWPPPDQTISRVVGLRQLEPGQSEVECEALIRPRNSGKRFHQMRYFYRAVRVKEGQWAVDPRLTPSPAGLKTLAAIRQRSRAIESGSAGPIQTSRPVAEPSIPSAALHDSGSKAPKRI
jgi:hypothetical protein